VLGKVSGEGATTTIKTVMIQTKQAVERYRTLQHELIESLGTEQLLKLQQDCIEVAHKGHLLESNRLFKWAVIGALCFILMMFFPAVKVTLVVVLLIGFFGYRVFERLPL